MYTDLLTKQASESIGTYFNQLENTGYFRYDYVEQFLGYLLADTFLNTDFNNFVTEDDYRIIESFLQCLYGKSCLIPYPEYINSIPQISSVLPQWGGMQPFRITESGTYRSTEDGKSRLTEYRTNYWNNN